MNKDLKKEILKYTSAAAAVIAGTSANAQYQYTNIPDTTINTNNGFYNLDLDQDGNMDFTITQYVDTGANAMTNAVIIQPYTGTVHRIAGEKFNQYNYPYNMAAATVLDGTTEFNGAGGQFTTGYLTFVVDGQSYPNSNWVGPVSDGYLGLTLWNAGVPYYGWARLAIGDSSESFTVKDFAVNLTIDSAIVVGAELLGQIENELGAVTFRVTDGSINFNKPASIEQLDVRLLDLHGHILSELAFRDEHAELVLNELPAAVYLVEMRSKDMVRTEKIFIY
jgi:hypothetical protein